MSVNNAALFEAHPGSYIGPLVLSATLQGFQTGLLLNFGYRFWRDDFLVARRTVHAVLALVSALVLYDFTVSLFALYPTHKSCSQVRRLS